MGTDLPDVRGVESLNEEARLLTGLGEGLAAGAAGEEVGEGEVRTGRVDLLEKAVDVRPLALGGPETAVLGLPGLALDLDGEASGLAEDAPGLGGVAMDEFGAELDGQRHPGVPERQDAPADAVARFEDRHGEPFAAERVGGGESGHAGSDHGDIELFHAAGACKARTLSAGSPAVCSAGRRSRRAGRPSPR